MNDPFGNRQIDCMINVDSILSQILDLNNDQWEQVMALFDEVYKSGFQHGRDIEFLHLNSKS